MKKEYYYEINIARGLGVLIVLLGHSFPDAEIGVFGNLLFQWGYDACYSFHMALFFVVSGFVIGEKYYEGTYSLREEMAGKVKRLLVPYLFLSYISLLPKIVLNTYARNPVDASGAIKVLLGAGPNGSLWYLYTLVLFSVFALFCGKIFKHYQGSSKSIIILLPGFLTYALYLYAGETALHTIYLEKVCRYLIFFVIGMIGRHFYGYISGIYRTWGAIIALIVVVVFACPIGYKTDYLITALLGTYGILAIAYQIAQDKESKRYRFLDCCGKYSYDIYIVSYYVQQTIRVICFRWLQWNYTIVFLMELILGFVLSFLFSVYVLRRSRVLMRVLIGVWD